MKRLLLLILLGSVSTLYARDTPEVPPTFRVLSACGSYGGLYYDADYVGQRRATPLTINQTLSSPQQWPVDGKLILYRIIPPPPGSPPETPPSRQIILQSDLSGIDESAIVVIFPLTNERMGPLRAMLVPDTPRKHQAGTIKVINFSSHQALVALNEDNEEFGSGEIKVMKSGEGRVMVQVGVNKSGRWLRAFRGERRIAPQLRGYVFVFNYMVDPDYGEDPVPPPALSKIFFEVSPETREESPDRSP